MTKLISIVVSAYNEESNIQELYTQITHYLAKVKNITYEIIFVNDGSTDQTLQICKKIMQEDKRVKIINFFKNFGHEIAMRAGLEHATGNAVIFMDADLQHPPSLLPTMIKKWQEGHEIVFTRCTDNMEKSLFRKIIVKFYYWLINSISDIKIASNMPDFRLIDRTYIDQLKQLDEREGMFRAMLMLIGFSNEAYIDFVAPKRFSGKTHYNLTKSIKLAVNSIIQFSIKPLRLATYTGIFTAILSSCFGIYTIFEYFYNPGTASGYPTIICVIVFVFSIQMIMLGIIGEYIGRIHIESKKRPLYFAQILNNKNDKK
jgi:dolichol-phosphate mannosyltransferase